MYQELINKCHSSVIVPSHVKRVVLNVSETCFFKCKMCSFWKNKNKDLVLDIEIWSDFFKHLEKIKCDDTEVTFTGGEPLTMSDIFKWISLSTKHGFITNLNTNGWLLNDKAIKRLYESKLTHITISLDGSCPKVHDKIRGVPGSFDRVMIGAKKIYDYFTSRGKKITITITTVLSALNIHDIINLVELVNKKKYISGVWLQCVSAPFYEFDILKSQNSNLKWNEIERFKHLWPSKKEQVMQVYSNLLFLKKKVRKIINTDIQLKMQFSYFLDPDVRLKNTLCNVLTDLNVDMMRGFAFSCLRKYKDIALGNIIDNPIDKLWNSHKTISLRRKMINCISPCHEVINCNKKIELNNNLLNEKLNVT